MLCAIRRLGFLLQVLRMAMYELIHLERPAHVVSTFVDLAKATGQNKHASGFVNGVLKAFLRDRDAGKQVLPQVPAPPAGSSACECALHPLSDALLRS